MLINKTEVKYLVLAVLGRKLGTKTERDVLKRFIHRSNWEGPLPSDLEPKLQLTAAECKLLYERMLQGFICHDYYIELLDIIRKIRKHGESIED